MFGFLPAPCSACQSDDHEVYRAYFCGLSSALARDYGPAARFFTNRDGTFFSILAASLSESEPRFQNRTCCNPLAKKRQLFDLDDHASYAAAVSVCGVYTKLRDDAEDEAGFRKLASGIGCVFLERSVRTAREVLSRYQFPTREVERRLDQQSLVESSSSPGEWRRCSTPTEHAYSTIFQYAGGLAENQPVANPQSLGTIGGLLGRVIYLIDAFEDREEDLAKGRFNPLVGEKNRVVIDSFEREFSNLEKFVGTLEPIRYQSLLNQILLEGLYAKCEIALGMSSGSSRKKSKKERWFDRCCDWCDCITCCDCNCGGKKKDGGDCMPDCDCCPCDCG